MGQHDGHRIVTEEFSPEDSSMSPDKWLVYQVGKLASLLESNHREIVSGRADAAAATQAILVTLNEKHEINTRAIDDTRLTVHRIGHDLNNTTMQVGILGSDLTAVKLQIVDLKGPVESFRQFKWAYGGFLFACSSMSAIVGLILSRIPFIRAVMDYIGPSIPGGHH